VLDGVCVCVCVCVCVLLFAVVDGCLVKYQNETEPDRRVVSDMKWTGVTKYNKCGVLMLLR